MKSFVKRIVALTLSLLIIVSMLPCSMLESYAASGSVTESSITPKNWMAYLPNTASLGQINIPATHDSGCKSFLEADLISATLLKDLAKTQDLDIKEQLNAGIRAFDIRLSRPKALAGYTDKLVINHGGLTALRVEDIKWLTIDDVIRYYRAFLKEHPSETIILRYNSEDSKAMDSDENGRYGELVKEFRKELIDRGDIVLNLNDPLPTVGEARGKIICFDTHIMKKDDMEYEGVYGETKWYGGYSTENSDYFYGIKHYFDNAHKQDYMRKVKLIGDDKSDGLQFLGTDCYILSIAGVPMKRKRDDVALYVNDKLLNYNYKNGYYYGWISMDYATKDIAEKIYMSNIFDYEENGGSIKYISDINFAYDQEITYAKSILEDKGYTVLDENFNCEGPDKIFSNAIVNGRRNTGSFNIAVGYKTTSDPMKAITGLKFATFPPTADSPSQAALDFVKDGNYRQVTSISTFDCPGSYLPPMTNYELCNFNIGASYSFCVNLYYTKDQSHGERLCDLQSLEMLNRTQAGTFESDFLDSQAIEYLNSGYRAPRDYKNNIFGSNYGRNMENDVYLFYKKAFPTSIPSTSADKEYKILGTVSSEYGEWGKGEGVGSESLVSKYLVKHTKPSIIKVSKSNGKKITFKNSKWDTLLNKQINKYQLYRSTSKKFNKNLKKMTIKVSNSKKSKLTYTDKSANKNTKYYYKLRGIVKLSGKNFYTKWSNYKK